MKPLDNEVYLLEDIFEPLSNQQVDLLRKGMDAIDKEFNMTSSSNAVKIQDSATDHQRSSSPRTAEDSEAVTARC